MRSWKLDAQNRPRYSFKGINPIICFPFSSFKSVSLTVNVALPSQKKCFVAVFDHLESVETFAV